MNTRSAFFHYKKGHTVLHKMPPALKILLMLIMSAGAFYVPPVPAAVLYVILFFLAFFYFRFSIKEMFSDFKPALVYVLMLFLVCLISNIVMICKKGFGSEFFWQRMVEILHPDKKFFPMAIHLCLSLAITSLFFRTTTVLQFNEGFMQIEGWFTGGRGTQAATTLALTITFIPGIAAFWQRLCYAWKNRGGRENPDKLLKLTPALFKASMNNAYLKSMARMNRM